MLRRGLIFIVCIYALLGQAQAGSALKTLMTGDDSRGWQAVGRLNIGDRSFCTGALIAEDLVLTAAHCMYDLETGERIDDSKIEFLADWRGGRAAAYRGVKRSIVHPAFASANGEFVERVAHDVAIIELEQPIRNGSIKPFATDIRPLEGMEVGVVSYAHDRSESPSLQEVCHVLARHNGSLVLSCNVDFGSSGAPIFVIEDGTPRIVSLVSAKAKVRGEHVALGTNLNGALTDLMALRAESDGVFGRPKPVVHKLNATDAKPTSGAKFLRP